MFKYYLRARWRDYIGWGCLLLLMVVWFFADRDLTKPPVFTEETLPYLNISYGTDFATVEAAEQGLPAFMVARFFSFAAPRFNGSLWIVLLLIFISKARL